MTTPSLEEKKDGNGGIIIRYANIEMHRDKEFARRWADILNDLIKKWEART